METDGQTDCSNRRKHWQTRKTDKQLYANTEQTDKFSTYMHWNKFICNHILATSCQTDKLFKQMDANRQTDCSNRRKHWSRKTDRQIVCKQTDKFSTYMHWNKFIYNHILVTSCQTDKLFKHRQTDGQTVFKQTQTRTDRQRIVFKQTGKFTTYMHWNKFICNHILATSCQTDKLFKQMDANTDRRRGRQCSNRHRQGRQNCVQTDRQIYYIHALKQVYL